MIDDFIARHKTEYQDYLKKKKEKDSSRVRALFSYNHKEYVKFEEEFYQKESAKPSVVPPDPGK